MCVGLLREDRADHGAGARRGQRAAGRRRPHRARRHPRGELRLRGAQREERGAPSPGAGRRSLHREAPARGEPRADPSAATSSRSRTWAPPGLTSSSAEMAARGGVGVRDRHRPGAHPRAGHDALRDPALRIAGADAGGGRAGPRRRGAGGLRQVGARRHADRPRHRRRGLPRHARRPHGRRRFPGSGWSTTAPVYYPEAREAEAAIARRAATPAAARRGRASRATSRRCSTRRPSRASAGSTSSTIPPCRHPPCSAPAAMPA